MITRRGALAAGAGLAFSRSANAQDAVRIRISTAAPPSDFLSGSLQKLKADIDGKSGLSVEVYPASTLFKQGTEVPALQRGTLEMSTMTTFEVAQQMPQYGFFNRGYLFRDVAHLHAVFSSPIGVEYRRAVEQTMGIMILSTAYLGTRQVNLRRKRVVNKPADLAGVKMRMPAGPEWLLLGKAIGVNPVPMGMPEVYLALKTGTIDGQENPLSIFNAAKLYEVSEQIALTSHMLQPVFFSIASPVWNKMSDEQKSLLQTACTEAAAQNDSLRVSDESAIVAAIKARGLSVDLPDLAAFRANADAVYAESSAAKAWDAALAKRVAETA